MKHSKAQDLITKILDDIDRLGIIINTVVEDLQKLRPYAVEEKEPVIAKAIRLTYEHVAAFETFAIPIPEDDPIEEVEEEEETTTKNSASTPEESLSYIVSLMKDSGNKLNMMELKEYNEALIAYAEENE